MQIKFSNGKIFTYIQAFGLERDFKDGYTRPSIEVIMSLAQTSFDEIYNLLHSNATEHIILAGDTNSWTDENGKTVTNTPTSEYNNYNVVGKIIVEDENISFKLYKQISSMEKERNEAIRAVDELLLAMEG